MVRLLGEGMPVDSVDGAGMTALQHAARNNQTDVIHDLLQRGGNVNKRDRGFDRTALFTGVQGLTALTTFGCCCKKVFRPP